MTPLPFSAGCMSGKSPTITGHSNFSRRRRPSSSNSSRADSGSTAPYPNQNRKSTPITSVGFAARAASTYAVPNVRGSRKNSDDDRRSGAFIGTVVPARITSAKVIIAFVSFASRNPSVTEAPSTATRSNSAGGVAGAACRAGTANGARIAEATRASARKERVRMAVSAA